MHYEINVSKDGKHLFATHERSLLNKEEAQTLYLDFCERFPKTQGYVVLLRKAEIRYVDVAVRTLRE